MKKLVEPPKVGQDIYVESAMSISHGSTDVVGGLAKVTSVEVQGCNTMVSVKELPGHSYGWEYLSEKQEELKKRFGKKRAYPDPDIDTPWIEDGDWVNGETYHGPDIW